MMKELKEVRCPICNELIGYNEEGTLFGIEGMFCKNRPHNRHREGVTGE